MSGAKRGTIPGTRVVGPKAGWRPASARAEVPKERKKLTAAQIISGIKRGFITDAITSAVRNVDQKQSKDLYKALKDFDPAAGVGRAIDQIEARLVKQFENRNLRARDGLTFGRLIEETGHITELARAFFVADLPVQSATVYLGLVSGAESWITGSNRGRQEEGLEKRRYHVYDGEDQFSIWDESLTGAVLKLDCKAHRGILLSFKKDLTDIVTGEASDYGVELKEPLSECRKAIDDILDGKKYTCSACRHEKSENFQYCSEACNQQRHYAAFDAEDEDTTGSKINNEATAEDVTSSAEKIEPECLPQLANQSKEVGQIMELDADLLDQADHELKAIEHEEGEEKKSVVQVTKDEGAATLKRSNLELQAEETRDSIGCLDKRQKQDSLEKSAELERDPEIKEILQQVEEFKEGLKNAEEKDVALKPPPPQVPLEGEPKLQIKIPGRKAPVKTIKTLWSNWQSRGMTAAK